MGRGESCYAASTRHGDNLYSDSVVALRGTTGQLLWHFQFTPGDTRNDWDSNQTPLLADRNTAQGLEKAGCCMNRNGFYYVLDRMTGAFRLGVLFARENWTPVWTIAGGRFRPRRPLSACRCSSTFPGAKGATNWWSPSYDRDLDLVFIPVLEEGMIFFPSAQTLPTTGGRSFYTAIRALDASTGKLKEVPAGNPLG